MKGFSAQLLMNYISGADIPEDVLERLENNEEFMLAVFNHTKDVSMFRYVSDNLKGNARFIRKLVEMFEYNIEFVVSILNSYEEYSKPIGSWDCMSPIQIAEDELAVIVSRIYDRTEDYRLSKYKISASQLVNSFKVWVGLVMHEDEEFLDDNFDSNDNLYFEVYLDVYHDSPILLEVHFKELISSLVCADGLNLEETIHTYYGGVDPNNLDSKEVALKLISIKEPLFAEYLRLNSNYLNDICKQIDVIKKRWNNYLYGINREKAIKMFCLWEEAWSKKLVHVAANDDYCFSLLIEKLGLESIFSEIPDVFTYVPSSEIDNFYFDEDNKVNYEYVGKNEKKFVDKQILSDEFIVKLGKLMRIIFSNELPYSKQKLKQKFPEDKFVPKSALDENETAIIKVDFKNKKILDVIRRKKERMNNDSPNMGPKF